jgi:hypothetical protein
VNATRPLGVERLEDRWLLSDIIFTAPGGAGQNDMLLRRNGNKIELYLNGVLKQSQNDNSVRKIQITGASNKVDKLTVDFNVGGFFSVRDGITFTNAPSVGGTDTLVINATTGPDTINIATGQVTVNGSVISFTGLEILQVNTLAGADTATVTSSNPSTATTVDAGTDTQTDTFKLAITGAHFVGNLTILHFDAVTGKVKKGPGGVGGNLSGNWTVSGSGTIDDLTVEGSVTSGSNVMAENITTCTVMGNVDGTVAAHGSGTIGNMDVGGSIGSTGTIMAEDITTCTVMGTIYGTVKAEGSGTIGDLEAGAIASTGTVEAEDITTCTVMGDMSGTITVTVPPGGHGTGTLTELIVGGSTGGTVEATDVGTISGVGVAASPVFKIKEGPVGNQVLRQLVATPVNGTTSLSLSNNVKFVYFYDSTVPGDAQVSVKIINTAPSSTRFDLSLTTVGIGPMGVITDSAAPFNLGRLYASGTSGVRSVAVEGDILDTMSAKTLVHFGLPAGTPGGVRLPGEILVGVTAQDKVWAGTLQAGSVQAVAFGSITKNGVTTLAENATKGDAAGWFASGTATMLANGTFSVPFAEGRPVVFFLVTGSSGLDTKGGLCTDQSLDNLSVTAVVTAVSGNITSLQFLGDGGSINTALSITGPIPSTGPLGDLILSSSFGVGNVTAPSIFGNIDTNGPIFGKIQTTGLRTDPITGIVSQAPADLGRPLTNGSGTVIGTTIINTTQGITGQIISRGGLVSKITSQKAFTGSIAAQLDIGYAYVNAGQLVRFGGLLSNGQFSGSVVALGNILGDIQAKSGLAGRIAAKGRVIPGLVPSRFGILGNLLVSGNIETNAAIVSCGVIGDAFGGTVFSSGAMKGILAAKGDINFGGTGSITGFIFENVASSGSPQYAGGANAAAIDAIFTDGGSSLLFDTGGNLVGLGKILTDLGNLKVTGGILTGPVP